ncbi:hypothetical protein KAH81_08395, partial [bacterium]|nr:hypothetical protein [bacterium]
MFNQNLKINLPGIGMKGVFLILFAFIAFNSPVLAQTSPDSCAPEVMHWTPADGATGVDPSANIFAYLYDSPGVCGVSSGIDSSTIEMIVVIGDDTLDVTGELRIVMHGTVDVTLNHPAWGFPAGSHVEVCLTFADTVGNFATDCIEFDVASTSPDTLDRTPPCFDDWFPANDAILSASPAEISVAICDICGGDTTGGISGVDPDSVIMVVIAGSDTTIIEPPALVLTPIFCAGYGAQWNPPVPLPEGNITVCVGAVDFAGNPAYDCVTWTIDRDTMPPPPDCAPEFVSVDPGVGAWDVATDHGINMVFGPRG